MKDPASDQCFVLMSLQGGPRRTAFYSFPLCPWVATFLNKEWVKQSKMIFHYIMTCSQIFTQKNILVGSTDWFLVQFKMFTSAAARSGSPEQWWFSCQLTDSHTSAISLMNPRLFRKTTAANSHIECKLLEKHLSICVCDSKCVCVFF